MGIRKKAAEGGGNFAAENGFAPGKVAEEGGRKAAGRKSMSARLIIRRILVNFAGVKRNKE